MRWFSVGECSSVRNWILSSVGLASTSGRTRFVPLIGRYIRKDGMDTVQGRCPLATLCNPFRVGRWVRFSSLPPCYHVVSLDGRTSFSNLARGFAVHLSAGIRTIFPMGERYPFSLRHAT